MTLDEYRDLVKEMFPKYLDEIQSKYPSWLVRHVALSLFANNNRLNSTLAIQTREVLNQIRENGDYTWDDGITMI